MDIYLMIVLFDFLIFVTFRRKIPKKYIDAIFGFVIFIISGLRDYTVGIDTRSYAYSFVVTGNTSWSNILHNFNITNNSEILYTVLEKACYSLSHSYTILFLAVSALYAITITRFIDRYSKNSFISFTCVIVLGSLFFSMQALRQSIAICFCIMSVECILKRQPIRYTLLMLIGFMFHNSIVAFAPLYFLINAKRQNISIYALVTIVILIVTKKDYFISGIGDIFGWTRFKVYTKDGVTLSLSGAIVQLSLYIFCYTSTKDENNISVRLMSYMMLVGALIQTLTLVNGNFYRISNYYNFANIILIPRAIYNYENKGKGYIGMIAVLALIMYLTLFAGDKAAVLPYKLYFH